MFESPLVFALVFFGLGFAAGIIVAVLFQAGKSSPPLYQGKDQNDKIPVPSPSLVESASAPVNEGERAGAEGDGIGTASSPRQDSVTWVSSRSSELPDQPEKVPARPIESFVHMVRSSTLKEPGKPRTMAAEIDAILQEKLPDSDLAGRIVRIEEQPDFGLLVLVDGEKYAGVNAVPDEAVRAFIKSAVAEWQDRSRSTPNS
jgi:hypothetical protein